MKRVTKKQKTRRPAFDKQYQEVAGLLESNNAHAWYPSLIGLLGLTVGALALLGESAYTSANDAQRLTELAKLLDAVEQSNTKNREEAIRN